MAEKVVRIACQGAGLIEIDEAHEIQGELKSLSADAFAKLKKEIVETGFAFPLHIWRDPDGKAWIVGGHQRKRVLVAMREDGFEVPAVPFVEVQAESLIQAKRRVLQDAAQYGTIESQGLYEFMEGAGIGMDDLAGSFDLPALDLDDFRMEFYEDNTVEPGPTGDPDDAPEAPVEPSARPGDVYQLGRHRLLCGDATDMTAVQHTLLQRKIPDMVFTDPPYGVKERTAQATNGRGGFAEARDYAPVIGDDSTQTAIDAVNLCLGLQIPLVVFFGANYFAHSLPEGSSWIVWDKREGVGQDDNADCELAWTSRGGPARLFSHLWKGAIKRSEHGERRVHPTQKPVALAEWAITEYPRTKVETVLDLFGGSGSTLIACEKTGRRCFMVEIDPRYIDVIVARWEKFTGKQAKLLTPRPPDDAPAMTANAPADAVATPVADEQESAEFA